MWTRLHGGVTHFPIALLLASFLFDLLALLCPESRRRDFRIAAYYALMLAAVGAVGAIVSGLFMCKWNVDSDGLLAMHHQYVWISSALLVGLAVFRTAMTLNKGALKTEHWPAWTTTIYLLGSLAASVLISIAGYWGGEMLIR